MTMADLCSRVDPVPLHIVHPIDIQIPVAVCAFLGKSEKLAPTPPLPSWEKFYNLIDAFKVRLHRQIAIEKFRSDARDELHKLRRPFFKPTSSWTPPVDALPDEFGVYCSRTSAELAYRLQSVYAKRRPPSNLSEVDRYAMKWLAANRSIVESD